MPKALYVWTALPLHLGMASPWGGGVPVNTLPELQARILPRLPPDAGSHVSTGGNLKSMRSIPEKAGIRNKEC